MKLVSLSLIIALSTSLTYGNTKENYVHPIPSDNEVLLSFGNRSQKVLPKRLSFLVWNLHKGTNQSFTKDFNQLARNKDFIIAQEMLLDDKMKNTFTSLPLNYYSTATSFFMGKDLFRTGVATGGKVAPIGLSFVRTKTLEPVINSPKITLITHYPIAFSEKILTVVNIHGINFVDGQAYREEMARLYEVLKNSPGPLIFTGDFNSWNDDRNIILKEVCDNLHLNEAHFFPDNRMRFNKHPLDHFFYSDDIKIIEAKVEDYYQGSDHKPLEIILEYSPS